ncbi:MAG: GNAT family N-acetyltransferase [Candidatus Thorarchaeota archaeon]
MIITMIKEISLERLDDIHPIIDRFRESIGNRAVPDDFSEKIRDSVANDRASLFGDFADDGSLRGIGLFGKVNNRISFVFADGDFEIEKTIATALFDKFSPKRSYIVASGLWISESMSQLLVEIGFSKHDRVYMTLTRESVEDLPEPIILEGMHFDSYIEKDRQAISDLVFKCNDGHVDQDVFPEFFETPESCLRLVKHIEESKYGEYKEGHSWILRKGDQNIGVCFMTCRNGDTGYIPDIVLEPEFRGQGLGKAILVQSMKRQLESDSAISKVDLDVTLNNNARFLYRSLGFKDVQEYTMYTWKK